MVQLNITVFDDAHPLTEGIRETFSTNVLPFTGSTWAIVAGLFSLFLIHECYAACFRPILTRPDHREGNTLLQAALLFYWFCMYMNESLLLPVTLDFAESMGESSAMSGFFGSSSLLASVAGVMMGRVLVSESQWNQRWARTVVIWSPLLGMALTLIEARVSNAHVLGDDSSKRTAFWTMIMLVQPAAFFQSVPYVPMMATWHQLSMSLLVLVSPHVSFSISNMFHAGCLLKCVVSQKAPHVTSLGVELRPSVAILF